MQYELHRLVTTSCSSLEVLIRTLGDMGSAQLHTIQGWDYVQQALPVNLRGKKPICEAAAAAPECKHICSA